MKKLILSLTALVAFGRCSAMEQKQELDKKTEHRLKYGALTTTKIQPSVPLFTAPGKFPMVAYIAGGTHWDTSNHFAVRANFGYYCFDTSGNSLNQMGLRHITLPLDIQTDSYTTGFTSLKNYFCNLKTQVLRHRVGRELKVCVSLDYPENKHAHDRFIFDNPMDPVLGAPEYANGLVCAITAPFPVDMQRGTLLIWEFDNAVLKYVEPNTHVCLYKVNGQKLELLRDLGKFPYCVGAYVNRDQTMVAVLHGINDGITNEKCLKFITINDPCLSLEKAKNNFSDVLINCEK